jgi:hypothetical protein
MIEAKFNISTNPALLEMRPVRNNSKLDNEYFPESTRPLRLGTLKKGKKGRGKRECGGECFCDSGK